MAKMRTVAVRIMEDYAFKQLPPLTILAESYGCGYDTIRQLMAEWTEAGYVDGRQMKAGVVRMEKSANE